METSGSEQHKAIQEQSQHSWMMMQQERSLRLITLNGAKSSIMGYTKMLQKESIKTRV